MPSTVTAVSFMFSTGMFIIKIINVLGGQRVPPSQHWPTQRAFSWSPSAIVQTATSLSKSSLGFDPLKQHRERYTRKRYLQIPIGLQHFSSFCLLIQTKHFNVHSSPVKLDSSNFRRELLLLPQIAYNISSSLYSIEF